MNELTQIIQDTTLVTNVIPDTILVNIPTLIIAGGITIVSGIFVLVLGQIFIRFILEPVQKFYTIKGQLATILIKCEYVNVKGVDGILKNDSEVTRNTSDIAGQIIVSSYEIRWYGLCKMISFKTIPSKKTIEDAAKDLIKISYLSQQRDNSPDMIDLIEGIRQNLNLRYNP